MLLEESSQNRHWPSGCDRNRDRDRGIFRSAAGLLGGSAPATHNALACIEGPDALRISVLCVRSIPSKDPRRAGHSFCPKAEAAPIAAFRARGRYHEDRG